MFHVVIWPPVGIFLIEKQQNVKEEDYFTRTLHSAS